MSERLRWRVAPARSPLRGSVRVPGDKSIGHRAVILGALADGTSTVRGLSGGADNRATREAFARLGVAMRSEGTTLTLEGRGIDGLRAPDGPLDCGNSGTTARILLGVLAAQPFASTLVGDESLSRRPMGRVLRPLRGRGARVEGTIDPARKDEVLPVSVLGLDGHRRLWELEHELSVASAQVKSALLLSGLWADGPTALREPTLSRDHTERMLLGMGAPLHTLGAVTVLDPDGWDRRLRPLDLTVPGDPSSAAFLLLAGLVVPGSRVVTRGVCCNPTRTGFLEVVRDMGGDLAIDPKGSEGDEPVGDLHVGVRGDALRRGARCAGELAVRAIDEVPALAALAAVAPGTSTFADLRELRVKESDRVEALVAMLRAFGLQAEEQPDGFTVEGGRPRGGAVIDSHGDHRIAMAAAVLALAADGPTVIDDVACVGTSYPGFAATLRALGAALDVEESS